MTVPTPVMALRHARLTALQVTPEPILFRLGLAMLAGLAVTVPALLMDPRQFQGEPVWIKPIKFQFALAFYFLTLSVYAGLLPPRITASARLRRFLSLVVLAALAEMIWICGAAMFATASHYNTHPAMTAIYGLMGAAAILLTSASLVLGLAFWRGRLPLLPEPLRLSLALGLILTFVLTLPTAGTLSALPGHLVGTPETGAALPVLGWSREVGDLRAAHFLATHALHVVPLAGIAALWRDSAARGSALVWAAAGAHAAATAAVFVQALMGRPFI